MAPRGRETRKLTQLTHKGTQLEFNKHIITPLCALNVARMDQLTSSCNLWCSYVLKNLTALIAWQIKRPGRLIRLDKSRYAICDSFSVEL